MLLSRRGFLRGLIAAPAVIRPPRALSADCVPGAPVPAAVVSAGAQVAWALRTSTGWLTRPKKVVGVDPLPAGWALDAAWGGIRTERANPDPMIGYDTGGRCLAILHSGVEIGGCRIWHNGSYSSNGWLVRLGGRDSVTDINIHHCEFDGLGEKRLPTAIVAVVTPIGTGTGRILLDNNWVHGMGGDNFSIWRGGASKIRHNRLEIGGWRNPKAHFDSIELHQDGLAGPSEICDNFIDMTPGLYDPATNSAGGGKGDTPNGTYGRTSAVNFYACPYGVDYHHNVIIGMEAGDNGVYEFEPFFRAPVTKNGSFYANRSPIQSRDIRVYNNVHSGSGNIALSGVINAAGPSGLSLRDWKSNYRFSSPSLGGSLSRDNQLYPPPAPAKP